MDTASLIGAVITTVLAIPVCHWVFGLQWGATFVGSGVALLTYFFLEVISYVTKE